VERGGKRERGEKRKEREKERGKRDNDLIEKEERE
jgi:hypothetical protein